MDTNTNTVRATRGPVRTCKGWHQEAALRMLMNNLDPEVAENPDDLVVYGGNGRAARNWDCFDAIVRSLEDLENDETLLIQTGKPVGIFRLTRMRPGFLSQIPFWSEVGDLGPFSRSRRTGLMMYGQMTAGSWIYIGTQGIVQGTYETLPRPGASTSVDPRRPN